MSECESVPGVVRAGKRGISRKMRLFRTAAVAILAAATICLSSVGFASSKNREKGVFNIQYESFSEQLVGAFRENLQNKMLALDAFSIELTSYSSASNLKFPMFTLPEFPVRGLTLRNQMKANALGFLPLVTNEERASWETYALKNQGWIKKALKWEKDQNPQSTIDSRNLRIGSSTTYQNSRLLEQDADFSTGISKSIYRLNTAGKAVIDDGNGPFTPVWMTSPAPKNLASINFNMLSHQHLWREVEVAVESAQAVLSKVLNLDAPHESITGEATRSTEPVSTLYYPVFDQLGEGQKLVGLLASEMEWKHFFEDALPSTAEGIIVVVENACNQIFTFRIDGAKAIYLGQGDLHDPSFNDMVEKRSISFLADVRETFPGSRLNFEPCPFSLQIYPSTVLEETFESNDGVLFASSILALFFISAAIFFIYDNVGGRQSREDQSVIVLERKSLSGEVEPSLKDKIMQKIKQGGTGKRSVPSVAPAHFKATIQALPSFLGKNTEEDSFSDATIMFADIYGLEAWSTGKEPEERANLLDVAHRTFVLVGKKCGIKQIEMTNDCFVAICGSRGSDNDHAEVLVRFACESRRRLTTAFKGMGAKGLAMRYGVHSGHVQTGAFGDNNARFQLFGDTTDTTYQMLSTSRPGKVHVSVETAELLNLGGKGQWLAPRGDLVPVEGKGEMSTFWIKPKACLADDDTTDILSGDESSVASETSFDDVDAWEKANLDQSQSKEEKLHYVVERAVETLARYLKKIQAHRNSVQSFGSRKDSEEESDLEMGNPIIEEARELVRMSPFDDRVTAHSAQSEILQLSESVESQLRLYISSIASTYRGNDFHNAEHALHATLTMEKMVKKMISPEEQDMYVDFGGRPLSAEAIVSDLDTRTFGLASDPLSQFALLFCTFVHDVDHLGVSNHQLVKEGSPIASLYKNKSVAEQNSVDIAWWLLMTPNFSDLRAAIYNDSTEMQRFRQILVNGVIATDILDRDMKVHRDKGWKKAFKNSSAGVATMDTKDLQATLVIEHMMQAADHGHAMQSFRTYNKWNQRLFEEMNQAYHSERAERDPAHSWYVGELAFFDKFIIPLATRLRDCGAFGAKGDEYLNNAVLNRRLWEQNGKRIVNEMKEKYNRKVVSTQDDTIVFGYDA